MGLQVSASRVGLLLECRRPFAPAIEVPALEASEPMRYGSCIHKMVERRLARMPLEDATDCGKWGVDDVAAAQRHADSVVEALRGWCAKNDFGVRFAVADVETPLATRIIPAKPRQPPKTRDCDFDEEGHRYDLREGEIGGTFDVLLYSPDWGYVVLDLKTGDTGDWTSPSTLPQILTLTMQLVAAKKGGRGVKWGGAILHAPRFAPPVVYAEEIPPAALKRHLGLLQDAYRQIGDGSMRPGDWCFRCPAREGCPTQDGALLARSAAMIRMSNAELMREAAEPGQLHMFLTQFEALAKRAREALREAVRRGEVIVRPDGKVLVLKATRKESLSKASIVKALGKEAGEALIEDLRQKGCVPVVEGEELRAVEDK